ncbi:MAG: hypothetical protein GY878_12480 [Fuerstiella sp.]|nr:hypothetical protein [Fuerstiella sp.]
MNKVVMTTIVALSFCFNVSAQDATENQPLSPEVEMAIMHAMNREDRLATRRAWASCRSTLSKMTRSLSAKAGS